MRTRFSPAQLNDTQMAQSEKILRACVHCGFCNATCPTYLQTGDENDGPRGRIYLMREMLQSSAAPDARTVAHIDSCLSCLGCATTCPSGVDYMRLVDHARAHIETHYRRPALERMLRGVLGFVLPHPARFAFAVRLGRLAPPFSKFMPARLARMTAMARQAPSPALTPPQTPPHSPRRSWSFAPAQPGQGEGLYHRMLRHSLPLVGRAGGGGRNEKTSRHPAERLRAACTGARN